MRADTISLANTALVAAEDDIPLVQHWGGGHVASADGIRFRVPVRTIYGGFNAKYFGRDRGITYYNLVSDQWAGLHGMVVTGTLRDSLSRLGLVLAQPTALNPTEIHTDTGASSDLMFGLFWLLGYHFSPRLADVGGQRLWRIDPVADYGVLNGVARHQINLDRIRPHWDAMLRLAGSLKLGLVQATNISRRLQLSGTPTVMARAISELERVIKSIHVLTVTHDQAYRRQILTQLNHGESRHAAARTVFHRQQGEVRQRYREGQEDQLGALGLVLNMITLWNTIYMDAIIQQLIAEGWTIDPADLARLSPLSMEHINIHGRFTFTVPEAISQGALRPLRTPSKQTALIRGSRRLHAA